MFHFYLFQVGKVGTIISVLEALTTFQTVCNSGLYFTLNIDVNKYWRHLFEAISELNKTTFLNPIHDFT
jgi:predicted Rossmann-fold nucleotide-binding protein